jgi:hypothetical protein
LATVTLNQLDCGMVLFTLLDGAMGSKPGLVRLSSSLLGRLERRCHCGRACLSNSHYSWN